MRSLLNFLKRIYSHRMIIKAMTQKEVKSRYAGTLVGFVWFIINPLMMLLVYWFVFSVGFKVKPAGDAPYAVVFFCGLIPWTLFAETLITSANSVVANSYLVKKTAFPTEILPPVYFFASLIGHAAMLVILVVLISLSKISLSFYNLQFIYYLFCLWVFTLGLSWLCSALNVFYRDVSQILMVLTNIWFWYTPIVWDASIIPEKYRFILKVNPMYYIVDGYKACFVYHVPFWYNYKLGIYYWSVSLALFVAGGLIFRKLKPEFAEVL